MLLASCVAEMRTTTTLGSNAVHISGVSLESNIDHIVFGCYWFSDHDGSLPSPLLSRFATLGSQFCMVSIFSRIIADFPAVISPQLSKLRVVTILFSETHTLTTQGGSLVGWSVAATVPSFYWDNTNFGRVRTSTIAGGVILPLAL